MAVFLLRAKYGSGYSPAPPVGIFGDVTPGVPFAKWIEKLSADGITAGCGGGDDCPTLANTRGQMAVFLTKTFAESSQALIAEALAYGDIDYPTSLLDRAYALFWDRRLPPRYIGAGSNGEDLGFFEEVKAVWDELTPQAQDSLEPFLVRPDDPVSVFGPAAPAGTRPRREVAEVQIDLSGLTEIARRGRGTPRVALRLLRRVRDYAQVRGDGAIDGQLAADALSLLDVDPLGLDDLDRRVLKAIIEKFAGGPVGLETIAASISEESDTIMDVVEPYLLQLGFWIVRRAAA